MRLTYNQHQYKDVLPEFTDPKTGASTLCLVCAIAKMMTEIRRAPYFPLTIVDLIRAHDGFAVDPSDGTKTILRWSVFREIWNMYAIVLRWTGSHYPLEIIKPPSIISVDGNRLVKGVQFHFVWVQRLIYNKDKVVNAEIYDPWHDRVLLLVPHYGDNMREAVYTIANFIQS